MGDSKKSAPTERAFHAAISLLLFLGLICIVLLYGMGQRYLQIYYGNFQIPYLDRYADTYDYWYLVINILLDTESRWWLAVLLGFYLVSVTVLSYLYMRLIEDGKSEDSISFRELVHKIKYYAAGGVEHSHITRSSDAQQGESAEQNHTPFLPIFSGIMLLAFLVAFIWLSNVGLDIMSKIANDNFLEQVIPGRDQHPRIRLWIVDKKGDEPRNICDPYFRNLRTELIDGKYRKVLENNGRVFLFRDLGDIQPWKLPVQKQIDDKTSIDNLCAKKVTKSQKDNKNIENENKIESLKDLDAASSNTYKKQLEAIKNDPKLTKDHSLCIIRMNLTHKPSLKSCIIDNLQKFPELSKKEPDEREKLFKMFESGELDSKLNYAWFRKNVTKCERRLWLASLLSQRAGYSYCLEEKLAYAIGSDRTKKEATLSLAARVLNKSLDHIIDDQTFRDGITICWLKAKLKTVHFASDHIQVHELSK